METEAPSDAVVRVRAWFAEHDPEVLVVADEVDRTLIRSALRRTPFERLDRAVLAARSWAQPWQDAQASGPTGR